VNAATTANPATLLTVSEVAERLRCPRAHVYRLIERGQLPAFRLGDGRGPIRIREDELEAWLERPEAKP